MGLFAEYMAECEADQKRVDAVAFERAMETYDRVQAEIREWPKRTTTSERADRLAKALGLEGWKAAGFATAEAFLAAARLSQDFDPRLKAAASGYAPVSGREIRQRRRRQRRIADGRIRA